MNKPTIEEIKAYMSEYPECKNKFEALLLFYDGKSKKEIAKEVHVAPSTITKWIFKAEMQGLSTLLHNSNGGRNRSIFFDKDIISEIENYINNIDDIKIKRRYEALLLFVYGTPITLISSKLKVTKGTISKWISKAERQGLSALQHNPKGGRPYILVAEKSHEKGVLEEIAGIVTKEWQQEDTNFWCILNETMKKKKISISTLINRANINKQTYYNLLINSMVTPRNRNSILRIILSLNPELEEFQQLLRAAHICLRPDGIENYINNFFNQLEELRKKNPYCDYTDFNTKYYVQLEAHNLYVYFY